MTRFKVGDRIVVMPGITSVNDPYLLGGSPSGFEQYFQSPVFGIIGDTDTRSMRLFLESSNERLRAGWWVRNEAIFSPEVLGGDWEDKQKYAKRARFMKRIQERHLKCTK